MAESYQSSPKEESTQEFVSGTLVCRSSFADVFGKYIDVKNRIHQIEDFQKQQKTHIDHLSKEFQSLKQLKEEESKLKQEIYKVLEQLETQVYANTECIKSLESKFDKFLVVSARKDGNQDDVMTRLVALEEKVLANTEACKEMKLRNNLEQRLSDSEALIQVLFKETAQLHEQINEVMFEEGKPKKQPTPVHVNDMIQTYAPQGNQNMAVSYGRKQLVSVSSNSSSSDADTTHGLGRALSTDNIPNAMSRKAELKRFTQSMQQIDLPPMETLKDKSSSRATLDEVM
uniref:Uncharacterized protein n=1 Tax=Amphimedon queenslandica TaxID=400682 RepID=A0A1X7UJX1_AMPQE